MPMSATPMVPVVPQEVPVANDVTAQMTTAAGRKISGARIFRP